MPTQIWSQNVPYDCCLLPSQVMIPQLNPPTKIVAVASPVLFYQSSWPIQLHFGIEPDCLQFIPELNPVEGAMQTEQIVDSIRHIYLGKHPLVVKQCCRCGGMALNQFQMRTTAIRAWDMRWARECLCGGRWRIHSFASN